MSVPTSFSWADKVWSWPVPGRYQLAEWPAGEAPVDALLAALRRDGASVGWLPADGGLIANLPVWENIVLPAAWPRRRARPELEQCIAGMLAACERINPDWLAQPVAQLDWVGRQRVGWLRQLLLLPEVLVLEPSVWPPEPGLCAAVEASLADRLWLALGPLPGWTVLACESLSPEESP